LQTEQSRYQQNESYPLNNSTQAQIDPSGELEQWCHMILPFGFPAQINFGMAGPEEAKNLAGEMPSA
jgi:hypothetical protein